MALVATYGNASAFNIKIFDMAGGGYYAVLYDGATSIFQRRNSAASQDTQLIVGVSSEWVLDHFTSYSYDTVNKILTLSGASDTFTGVIFTRIATYKFVADYVVEDTLTIKSNNLAAKVALINWNYYSSINAVIDIDNTSFGDGTSLNPLGLGVQLTANGSFYGSLADNGYVTQNNNSKQASAAVSGVAVLAVTPSGGQLSLAASNGYSVTLRQWFFKSTNTLYDFMLQAQLAVAVAKNYTGSVWDIICQVTAYLNIYLQNNLTDIKLIASQTYLNNMYFRDSFWQAFVVDKYSEQLAITFFESVQAVTGQIPNQINSTGAATFYQEESTLLYLIRAYYDTFVRNIAINTTAPALALSYINSIVVNNQYQITSADSGTFKSWMDEYTFTAGTYMGYTQGLYCVALKCAQALGLNVTNNQITQAIAQYQALYDSSNKFVKFASNKTYIAPDVLAGEALCNFLFSQPMLSDTAVNNTIDAMAKAITTAGVKVVATSTGAYIPSTDFALGHQYAQGDYQNGGSWFLYEYLAYYAGYLHGYTNVDTLINNRIAKELQSEVVSHEWLDSSASNANYLSEPAGHHVFSWNTASYIIRKNVPIPVTNRFLPYGRKLDEKF